MKNAMQILIGPDAWNNYQEIDLFFRNQCWDYAVQTLKQFRISNMPISFDLSYQHTAPSTFNLHVRFTYNAVNYDSLGYEADLVDKDLKEVFDAAISDFVVQIKRFGVNPKFPDVAQSEWWREINGI